MPVSYKSRMTQGKKYAARKAVRRARAGVGSTLTRFVGGNRLRGMIPAALRARGQMATELKTCDGGPYFESGAPILMCSVAAAAGGAVPQILLDLPIEGASFYNRIARRTRGVSLHIKGCIKPTLSNAAVPAMYARIIILYDRQTNGAAPTLATVLASYPEGGANYTSIQSGINPDNRDRFLVLRDRKFMLPALGINGVAPTTTSANLMTLNGDIKDSQIMFNEYIKLNGLETQYKASSGGAIGDISTGSYLIIAMTDSGLSQSPWALFYDCRYAFYD